jgi:two-component system nitrogen regulation response regulator GlnG
MIVDNKRKVSEIIAEMLERQGNVNFSLIRKENTTRIIKGDSLKEMVSLEEKIIELEESLFRQKYGTLYKSVLEAIERPLLEIVLERTEGNQLKAARILGLNRNTMRSKIKKLGINAAKWKPLT